MLLLTQLNGRRIVVNPEIVEFLESIPDTIITLTTGRKVIVREPIDLVQEMMEDYYRNFFTRNPRVGVDRGDQ
ncbi:MAG: flagellar FlbD family protein [Gemmatimonadetes bacterium]|nr:flagellar FlbD family protein [Gemmatimonadota bacterium]